MVMVVIIFLSPSFTPKYVAWLEMGGVLAVANLRGGGELEKEWHNAGRLDTKQNVFDDFLYASKFLEEQNIGNRKSTVISGRSNGGLLVGTTLIQNPDYFGAALPAVGVLDMLRFTEFTEGWEGVEIMAALSKILMTCTQSSNLTLPSTQNDECYSPTLTTTARRDDRVVPSHSYKFTARIQEYQDAITQLCFTTHLVQDMVQAMGLLCPNGNELSYFLSNNPLF